MFSYMYLCFCPLNSPEKYESRIKETYGKKSFKQNFTSLWDCPFMFDVIAA